MKNNLLLLLISLVVVSCGRADIGRDCRINGLGDGSCTFTNTGNGKGSLCVQPELVRHDGQLIKSQTICSGEVAPSTSVKIDFYMSGVLDFCGTAGVGWSDQCDLQVGRIDTASKLSIGSIATAFSNSSALVRECNSHLESIANALTMYGLDNQMPTNLRALTVGTQAILTRNQLQDPWGMELNYHFPSRKPGTEFDLCSNGPDKKPETQDDICL